MAFNWRNSLPQILAGIYPFLYFGPLMVLIAYPYPYPAWRITPGFQVLISIISILPIGIGFTAGWLKRFPLWSYPYFCLAVLFLVFGGFSLLNGGVQLGGPNTSILVAWILALVLIGLLSYFTRRNSPLPALAADIRADWTRLSLGLLILPALFFSGIDHDEDPILTVFVIGPSIILALTALLGILTQTKKRRALILAAGMALVILIRLVDGKFFYLIYWLFSLILMFSPALLDRRRA